MRANTSDKQVRGVTDVVVGSSALLALFHLAVNPTVRTFARHIERGSKFGNVEGVNFEDELSKPKFFRSILSDKSEALKHRETHRIKAIVNGTSVGRVYLLKWIMKTPSRG